VLGPEIEGAAARGETVVIENAIPDHAIARAPLGLHSAISVPLLQNGTWIASLIVGDREPRKWAPSVIGLVEDVTDRVGLWLEHVRALAEARHSEALANAARDSAFATRDAAFDEIRTIATRVGPEINNPLAVVVANASFVIEELRGDADPARHDEALRALAEIETAAARITRIVANLQQLHGPNAPSIERRARSSTLRIGKILAIDDDPLVLTAIRRMLREHDVLCLDNATDAITRLDGGEHFELILSDLMMPQVTGMDLYEHLRKHHPDVVRRLVFLTGGAVNERVSQFLHTISNVCLEKPIVASALREFVAQTLAKY
jgi:CheY-like chemotaxis protein